MLINKHYGSILPACLRAPFMSEDPKSVEIQSSHQYLLALLGSACMKDAHAMLMKLTLYVSFMT